MASFPACCRRSCKKRIESRQGGIKRSLIANRKEVETGASRVERAEEIDMMEMGQDRRRLLLEKLEMGNSRDRALDIKK